jgi:hypothetical protein
MSLLFSIYNNLVLHSKIKFADTSCKEALLMANCTENKKKIGIKCMRNSINLSLFAKRAQLTFGAMAKDNLLPFGEY